MKSLLSRAALASVLMGASVMAMAATPAPEGAKVSIISPADGATVDKTFTVKFGVEGIQLAPAGDQTPNTGHHHLLIDVDQPIAAGQVIPADANHVHFGKAQTEAEVTLAPGKHTLQLELADKNHMTFEPVIVSKKITVNVK
ncbi:DUF4399 domain-containing protein [Pseudomonas lundensis]|jgi:hypothetical protein|uniref:DUF4399 domain-containing protein n=1 Tax=Pseudomonas lundensis TaxID=86185 RepID=A0ABX4GQG0_9PSED|nr:MULTISPECIES: DUF4399 domain-containing protein [Pseudomonas]AOZ12851.1 ATPase [Pseudomonas lundensis]MBM1181985.1 DUF4399 domain-containing protein [Pseudomonas lundensis]MBS5838111.1 DUF4399 domain-containing protein [Pseudomonas sp.]NMZ53612.1 DUF4399 domain-containing protein [Pseudomonas lundensis]NNA09826.1 DUF4399 domain-containing protein [Pseudomonas lundensis]